MAMITCPHCGEQISDKAIKCVHCGELLIPENKQFCKECGAELPEDATECPNCGCPIEIVHAQEKIEGPQKVEVTSVKLSKKAKAIIGVAFVLIIAICAAILGVSQYQKEKAAEEYASRLENYANDLQMVSYTMLNGASDAEDCGNLIKKVWYNAIYEEQDDETDKYTKIDGSYVSDFNDALSSLFADSSFSSKIDSIEENRDSVNSYMKNLKNPPDEYKEAYEALSKFYDSYIVLTGCATDPTGTLQTYSNNFNDADTNALNCYNAMRMYLEE